MLFFEIQKERPKMERPDVFVTLACHDVRRHLHTRCTCIVTYVKAQSINVAITG